MSIIKSTSFGCTEMFVDNDVYRSKEQCGEKTPQEENTVCADVLLAGWVDGRITGLDRRSKTFLQWRKKSQGIPVAQGRLDEACAAKAFERFRFFNTLVCLLMQAMVGGQLLTFLYFWTPELRTQLSALLWPQKLQTGGLLVNNFPSSSFSPAPLPTGSFVTTLKVHTDFIYFQLALAGT